MKIFEIWGPEQNRSVSYFESENLLKSSLYPLNSHERAQAARAARSADANLPVTKILGKTHFFLNRQLDVIS